MEQWTNVSTSKLAVDLEKGWIVIHPGQTFEIDTKDRQSVVNQALFETGAFVPVYPIEEDHPMKEHITPQTAWPKGHKCVFCNKKSKPGDIVWAKRNSNAGTWLMHKTCMETKLLHSEYKSDYNDMVNVLTQYVATGDFGGNDE